MSHAIPMTEVEVQRMCGLTPVDYLAAAIDDCRTQLDRKLAGRSARKVDLFIRRTTAEGAVKLHTSPKECVEYLELAAKALATGSYLSMRDDRSTSYTRVYAKAKSCKIRVTILEFEEYTNAEVPRLVAKYHVSITTPTVYDDPKVDISPNDLGVRNVK